MTVMLMRHRILHNGRKYKEREETMMTHMMTQSPLSGIEADVWAITPMDARRILTEHAYEKQRPIHRETMLRYAASMKEGAWEEGTHIRFCVLPSGHSVLVDGYHRLTALIEARHTTTCSVSFTHVSNMSDVARHWSQMDNGKRRSSRDMVSVFDYASITFLPPKWVSALQPAAHMLFTGGEDHSKAMRVEVVRDATILYLPYAEEYFAQAKQVAPEIGNTHLRRSVFGVALLSYRYAAKIDRPRVDAFWELLRNDGLGKGDPRKNAAMHIATVRIRGGTTSGSAKKILRTPDDFAYVAACFNAWWDRKSVYRIPQPDVFSMRCVPPAEEWGKP